eukprot:c9818_g1_i1.p1 GENE.c9818_g1_i1~~c9818_g1_i1.p1  ORF type:complete len:162 (+),score=27.94 c9818_g1_i1:254-739(+)
MADNFTNECMTLSERVAVSFCTDSSCPVMNAGPNYKFLWQDPSNKSQPPTEISAPRYTANCLDWILTMLDDETFVPQELGRPFPKDFEKKIKKIFQRLVRIYAHWYRVHVQDFEAVGALAHLNTCFRHLYYFCTVNKLTEEKDWEPLKREVAVIVKAPASV